MQSSSKSKFLGAVCHRIADFSTVPFILILGNFPKGDRVTAAAGKVSKKLSHLSCECECARNEIKFKKSIFQSRPRRPPHPRIFNSSPDVNETQPGTNDRQQRQVGTSSPTTWL